MSFIDKMRAKALFHLKNKGGIIMDVDIEEIPKTWEFFPNTEDLWCAVNYPDDMDVTGCLYKGQRGTIFKGHRHNHNIEQFVILNEKGHLRSYTETRNKYMKYGDSETYKKGESHLVEFLEDTLIQVVWHPKMKGWNAEFIEDDK